MAYRIDLHCHTHASPDGSLNERSIKKMLTSDRLDVIAITDHNTIMEAARLQSVFGAQIIVGEEITTQAGEIIGLYLSEGIEPGLTLIDTVRHIQAQGGLVYIPHPFEKVRKGVTLENLETISSSVDLIEVFNGRSFSRQAQRQAQKWSALHNVPGIASSDSHGRLGWGNVVTELGKLPKRGTLVELAATARLHTPQYHIYTYAYPFINRFRNKQQR